MAHLVLGVNVYVLVQKQFQDSLLPHAGSIVQRSASFVVWLVDPIRNAAAAVQKKLVQYLASPEPERLRCQVESSCPVLRFGITIISGTTI